MLAFAARSGLNILTTKNTAPEPGAAPSIGPDSPDG